MARKNRIKLGADGTTYHVMSRAVLGTFLFDELIKEWIYQRIVALADIYYIDLHNITILDNHFHIILTVRKLAYDEGTVEKRFFKRSELCPRGKPWLEYEADLWHERFSDLSEFMKDLNQMIARKVKLEMGCPGHIFQDRYKSVLIEDGPGLLACMAYVALNPVRAGITKRASEYRWCSEGRFRQGGPEAAGVVMPPMAVFDFLEEDEQCREAFVRYVDHLADLEGGLESEFPVDHETIRALVSEMTLAQCGELVFRRTRWAVQSLVLGRQSFCRQIIKQFGMQKARGKPYATTSIMGLFHNSHARPGTT